MPGQYGFIVPNDAEIKKIVDELISYKLVTKEEVLAQGYSEFYEEYFYGKEFVDKKSLIGMQYYNKGIGAFNEEKYQEALNNFRKSSVYYDSPVLKLFIKNCTIVQLEYLELNTKEDIAVVKESFDILEFGLSLIHI